MTLTTENIILIGSILLFISVIVGKTSYKFGVPALVLFLAIGMLAGSDGIVGIHFDDPKIAQFIGIVSLNFILFSGGLDTNLSSVKPILKEGILLSTLGVLLTATVLGVFVWAITDLTIYESMLLGSIVSSTDTAAVFSILRSKNLFLKGNLRATLELESGSNDPMAYVLTITFLSLVTTEAQDAIFITKLFFQQMILGGFAGFIFGRFSKFIINEIKLDYEGLYSVLVIALMFITFSVTDFLNGNGFLAIYICAIYLGNQNLIHKNTILKMYDGLAWLMQIVLFLTLGLLVYPNKIISYIGLGLLISLFLIIIARPVSVFLTLTFIKLDLQSKLYISWVGLRGAVPIVFATYPLIAGIEKAEMIFNIVFFISLTSVLIQGTTLPVIAKWLNITLSEQEKSISEIDKILLDSPQSFMRQFKIHPDFYAVNKRIVDLNFPKSAFIVLIKRNGKYIRPGGSTQVEADDVVIVLADSEEEFEKVHHCLSYPQEV
ncbi:MAG: potassium/proton antiporter [Candidatus Thermochlorobacter sp.]